MVAVDSIINAKWIVVDPKELTTDTHADYLTNHSLVIKDGKIHDLLPQQQAASQYQAVKTVDLPEHLLTPGFINNHTHAAMNLLRGFADDLQLMEWLNDHMWPAENRWVSEAFVRAGTQLAAAEMLKCGTTQFNDMYFFPDVIGDAASEMGIKAHVGAAVFDFPCAWGSGPDEYFERGSALFDYFAGNELITCNIGPHAPYTVSDENFKRVADFAEKHQCRVNLHLHETKVEVEESLKKYQKRPIKRLSDLGLFEQSVIAVHMVHLNDEDFELAQKHQLDIVTCPESNLKLASGFPEVSKMQACGLNISIGTDGAASNNDLDMISEMRTTALLAKAVSENPTACNARTTLDMATINAAKALGVAEQSGSIAKGKDADVVAVAMDDLETLPLYNPISQLIYACNRQQVTDVWVRGKQLLANRALTTINENDLRESAKEWATKIGESRAEH